MTFPLIEHLVPTEPFRLHLYSTSDQVNYNYVKLIYIHTLSKMVYRSLASVYVYMKIIIHEIIYYQNRCYNCNRYAFRTFEKKKKKSYLICHSRFFSDKCDLVPLPKKGELQFWIENCSHEANPPQNDKTSCISLFFGDCCIPVSVLFNSLNTGFQLLFRDHKVQTPAYCFY